MEAWSIHGYSFFRHIRCKKVLLFVIFTIYFDSVSCATLQNIENRSIAEEAEQSQSDSLNETSFLHRQSLEGMINQHSLYLTNPAAFGFPVHQQPVNHRFPFASFQKLTRVPDISLHTLGANYGGDNELKQKDSESDADTKNPKLSSLKQNQSKVYKEKTKTKTKETEKGNDYDDKVESKTTDDGTERGCPGCVGGTCDAHIDPNTNISGIPVIQIIIGLAAGIFWAKIFLFILKNFIEQKEANDGGGYSPSPSQYGAPHQEYGAPPASSGYNTHRISYGNQYGRSTKGFTFNELSSWVWNAVDKFAKLYDD